MEAGWPLDPPHRSHVQPDGLIPTAGDGAAAELAASPGRIQSLSAPEPDDDIAVMRALAMLFSS